MTSHSSQFDRRTLLQSAAATAVAGAIASGGCGSRASNDRVLKVFNWSDYIDPEVIEQFQEAHTCRVVYDNFSSDSELEARLATGGGAYDVVFPSDRAMHSLLAKDLLQPLQMDRLKNVANLDPAYLKLSFDAENKFSLPYFWGTVAVGVRTDFVPAKVTGFGALFNPLYQGRITMLDDLENVVGIVLMMLKRPLNSVDPQDLEDVKDKLLSQRPLVQAYTSDSYRERLISGDAWISLGWSGDLLQAADIATEQGHTVNVVVPVTGTLKWLDSMAIPRRATDVELAHRFIDHLLDASVAARNAKHVHYATPNLAAFAKLTPEMAADQRIYPPPATLTKCQWLIDRGEQIALIEAVWREVRA
jgi:spermidine/putrescine transport system substrate-binding protein